MLVAIKHVHTRLYAGCLKNFGSVNRDVCVNPPHLTAAVSSWHLLTDFRLFNTLIRAAESMKKLRITLKNATNITNRRALGYSDSIAAHIAVKLICFVVVIV